MAASRDLCSHVTDVVTCPICLELFNSQKSLPCLHTFCLKCIEGHCKQNKPGDEVPCPVCRQKFNIPENGVKGLVNNFFIAGLVEARKTASVMTVQVPCEVCLLECDDNINTAVSTMYCVDCNQKLCEPCCRPHRRWRGGPHKVVLIGSEVETELIRTQGGRCDKHNHECVKLFCLDCEVNICVICFAEGHQQHKCKDVNTAAGECVKQIDADITKIKDQVDGAQTELNRLEEKRSKFLTGADDIKNQLVKTGEELKQLIDAQVNALMLEVQSLTTETCKCIESLKDNVEVKLFVFETFCAYCSELKTKGKPCDVTGAASDLHSRATQLLQSGVTLTDYCAPVIVFTPMDTKELLDAGQNFIGKVKLSGSTVMSSPISFATRGVKTLEQQLAQSADTERSLRQQIKECHSEMADADKMWTLRMNELQRLVKQLKQQETEMEADKSRPEKRISKLLARCEQLINNERDVKVKLEKSENELKSLNEHLEKLKSNENSLLEELKTTSDSEQLLREHLNKVPRVVRSLSGAQWVIGVTSLDDELYVLLDLDNEQVEVYNKTTEEYSLVRRLSLPGMKLLMNGDTKGVQYGLSDITSCKHYRCLYIADCTNGCVHRVELDGKVTKWSVTNEPNALSVTSQFTVLVTCCGDSKLLEMTTEGKKLREIDLQPDIVSPQHAIQLSSGQIVLCHGLHDNPLHRVCIVDTYGHVTQSYGGRRGSATVGRLGGPEHLAVDNDGFIFVADCDNSRVLLLSPTLSFVREIVSSGQFKGTPVRLFLDVDRRRLYVVDFTRVVVVQL